MNYDKIYLANHPFLERIKMNLTFAEAMALDPGEVEVTNSVGDWKPLSDWLGISLIAAMRTCKFRRARLETTIARLTRELEAERKCRDDLIAARANDDRDHQRLTRELAEARAILSQTVRDGCSRSQINNYLGKP